MSDTAKTTVSDADLERAAQTRREIQEMFSNKDDDSKGGSDDSDKDSKGDGSGDKSKLEKKDESGKSGDIDKSKEDSSKKSDAKKDEGDGDESGSKGKSGDKGSGDDKSRADEGSKDKDDKSDKSSDKKSQHELDLEAERERNTALLAQIEQLSTEGLVGYTQEGISSGESGKSAESGGSKDESTDRGSKEPESVKFVTDEEFEFSLQSADSLNALLNKVANTAALSGEQRGYERAMLDVPKIVDKVAGQTITVRDAARDFLEANSDLLPVRSFVGMTVNKLSAKNPDWGLKKLFDEAGKEVRETLKLSKVAKQIDDSKGSESDESTGLPKRGAGGGGSKSDDGKDGLTDMQKEIGELIGFAETGR